MIKLKLIKQRKEAYCGPICLRMIIDYFGIKISELKLVKLCKTDSHGSRAVNIIKAAKSLGLKGFVKDFCEIKDLRNYVVKKKWPVIVAWFSDDDTHYSVVVGLDNDNVYLADPEENHIKKIKINIFRRLWFDFTNVLEKKEDIVIRRIIVIHK